MSKWHLQASCQTGHFAVIADFANLVYHHAKRLCATNRRFRSSYLNICLFFRHMTFDLEGFDARAPAVGEGDNFPSLARLRDYRARDNRPADRRLVHRQPQAHILQRQGGSHPDGPLGCERARWVVPGFYRKVSRLQIGRVISIRQLAIFAPVSLSAAIRICSKDRTFASPVLFINFCKMGGHDG
jgi:hypothetical protein